MQLVVVTRDTPSRSRYGGMREVLARYEHAAAAGHEVCFVGFGDAGEAGGYDEVALRRRSVVSAGRRVLTEREPLQLGLRAAPAIDLDRAIAELSARRWPPSTTVVVAEQYVTLPVAAAVATALGAPLVHRTQNDEHAYAHYVAACERRPVHHLVLRAEASLVASFVRRWAGDPQLELLLHISPDSEAAWRRASRWSAGGEHVLLPPALPARSIVPNATDSPFRAVYIGALNLPQNAEEVRRFLAAAWEPFVHSGLPMAAGATLRLVGRGAKDFAATVDPSRLAGVEVVGDVDDPATAFAGCDVAINPAFGGSGVSIKTVEYLAHGLPVVTGAAGLRGLVVPPSVVTPEQSLFDGLRAAAGNRGALVARRREIVQWYRANLDPEAVLPPLWDRLALLAAEHQEVR